MSFSLHVQWWKVATLRGQKENALGLEADRSGEEAVFFLRRCGLGKRSWGVCDWQSTFSLDIARNFFFFFVWHGGTSALHSAPFCFFVFLFFFPLSRPKYGLCSRFYLRIYLSSRKGGTHTHTYKKRMVIVSKHCILPSRFLVPMTCAVSTFCNLPCVLFFFPPPSLSYS